MRAAPSGATTPEQPTESARRYAQIDPRLRAEFDQAYAALIAPYLAGSANPFRAEQQGAQELLETARSGFVPLAGYAGGGVHLQPPVGSPGDPTGDTPAARSAQNPYRTVFSRVPPERRPLLAGALMLLFGIGGVLPIPPPADAAPRAARPRPGART